ncbi:LPP20 family lipoprotein, partial [Francisella tularensis]|uniref:LPP20 family lipoprotein n=1 Tax=Francisella tularensis TaxID=263 RepID=UPI00238198A4
TSCCSTGIPENSKNIKNHVVIKQQTQKDTPNDTVPVWFSSGLPNTDQFLYGFGAAKSLEKATQKALADMVQKLQVTVS